jgi:hypothetical protein
MRHPFPFLCLFSLKIVLSFCLPCALFVCPVTNVFHVTFIFETALDVCLSYIFRTEIHISTNIYITYVHRFLCIYTYFNLILQCVWSSAFFNCSCKSHSTVLTLILCLSLLPLRNTVLRILTSVGYFLVCLKKSLSISGYKALNRRFVTSGVLEIQRHVSSWPILKFIPFRSVRNWINVSETSQRIPDFRPEIRSRDLWNESGVLITRYFIHLSSTVAK